jgi:uncharacterized protein with HEPN domain
MCLLAHDYFGIDMHIVWQTIVEDIPLLKKQIKGINENSEKENS